MRIEIYTDGSCLGNVGSHLLFVDVVHHVRGRCLDAVGAVGIVEKHQTEAFATVE